LDELFTVKKKVSQVPETQNPWTSKINTGYDGTVFNS
jgi:hypothetical protein